MKLPNFFVIGAPKCGTTALTQYLSEHPSVFISNPKEPFYWCFDAPNLKSYTRIKSFDDYRSLFHAANEQHIAVGEGSTEYLRSTVAVQKILDFNRDSRFIALLRNPIDLVYSFHGTQLFTLSEDEPDFETAWRLQKARSRGERLPEKCLDQRLVRYAEVGQLGTQLETLFEIVPEKQRIVILFDDFVADTKTAYERVLEFLCVPGDDRSNFPPVHEARTSRFPLVHGLIRRPPQLLAGPVMAMRRAMNKNKSGTFKWLKNQFSRKSVREPMRAEFREELRHCFQPEIDKLAELTGRDLSHWT